MEGHPLADESWSSGQDNNIYIKMQLLGNELEETIVMKNKK